MDTRKGFTFKELLIALAIFVLLVAIMLPALTRIPVADKVRILDVQGPQIEQGIAITATARRGTSHT